MAAVNTRRVLIGALVGGVVWNLWSFLVNGWILTARYTAEQQMGTLLATPRYPYFLVLWVVTLFVLALIGAWMYASVRATRGAGPATALKVGAMIGFVAGFPMNLSLATWSPISRVIPLWWTLDCWVGAILGILVAGWLYRD